MAKLYPAGKLPRFYAGTARQISQPRIRMHARNKKPGCHAFFQQAKAGLNTLCPAGQHHNRISGAGFGRAFLHSAQKPDEAAQP